MAEPNSRTWIRTALWLVAFFALAFALRSIFSTHVGYDAPDARHYFTGNDPYYHVRTVTNVVETGRTLEFDQAINYPEGNWNPNPPLWTWTTAPLASVMKSMGVADAVGTALNVMVAFWGAITVLPVYMAGKELWGRRAGLWAAFFIAVSAPHIQRSVWGYADHDAISMFFIVLAFAFLIKALKSLNARNYVVSWRDGSRVGSGLKEAFAANRNAIAWAGLSAVAITACAVVWKGYPYALAVIAVAFTFQLFIDHLRNRDTTAAYLVYLTVVALSVLLPWALYYSHYPNFFGQTVGPTLYVLYAIILLGLILVPTRDLPSVLVFPALVVALVGGALIVYFGFPDAWFKITSGLGYFNQSKLYSTIAEAQRPRLGEVAANFGFFTFLLAFWGLGRALKGAYKANAPELFAASWAVVAMFMTFAASRFIMNAAPLFAVLTGYAVARIIGLMFGSGEATRRFRSTHGQNIGRRAAASLDWKVVVGGVLVAVLFVLPNAWAGLDAGMSSEFEANHGLVNYTRNPTTGSYVHPPRFGAFGITFDLKDNGWVPVMNDLAGRDTGKDLVDRPAAIAWWDYGHWITGLGEHPAVADPFQSHYELSGRFIASDSEEEAMSWLTIHLIFGDARSHGGAYSPELRQYLDGTYPQLLTMKPGYGHAYDDAYAVFHQAVPAGAVYDLYEGVSRTTGKTVGYFAADDRMFPYDSPQTQGVDRQSIFYAPVYLANKNPDDYLQFQFTGTAGTVTMHRYGVRDNNSFELAKATYTDSSGRPWVEYQGYAYPEGQTPLQGYPASGGIALFQGESMQVQPKFESTMYARAFGGLTTQQAAGSGLTHWRVVSESDNHGLRQVVLLQYFHGVNVTGTLRDDAGQPLAGYTVMFVDGHGAEHGSGVSDAQGHYSALAPFASGNDLKLEVRGNDGATLVSDNRSAIQFTADQATSGASVGGIDITVTRAGIAGVAFHDENGNGARDANETVLAGATVSAGTETTTTGPDGHYSLGRLRPGTVTVRLNASGYSAAPVSVTLKSAEDKTVDLAATPQPSMATVRFMEADGTPIPDVAVQAIGPRGSQSQSTNGTGIATFQLTPGSYTLKVDANVTNAVGTERFVAQGSFVVPFGGKPVGPIDLRRQA